MGRAPATRWAPFSLLARSTDFEAILWIAAMIVVPILGLLAELFLFDHGLLWHREEKRDAQLRPSP